MAKPFRTKNGYWVYKVLQLPWEFNREREKFKELYKDYPEMLEHMEVAIVPKEVLYPPNKGG